MTTYTYITVMGQLLKIILVQSFSGLSVGISAGIAWCRDGEYQPFDLLQCMGEMTDIHIITYNEVQEDGYIIVEVHCMVVYWSSLF